MPIGIPILLNKVVLEYIPKYGQRLARLGGFEGVERRKCLKINARVFQVFTTEPLGPSGLEAMILG
ncbi:MAG: hypothetical protein ACLQVY_22305, partial [Limisphaerales bacterium]